MYSDIGGSLAKRVAKRKLERPLLCSSQSPGWYWVELGGLGFQGDEKDKMRLLMPLLYGSAGLQDFARIPFHKALSRSCAGI